MGCQISETPEPIDTNFGTGDYFGDITPHAKFTLITPVGTSGQMGERAAGRPIGSVNLVAKVILVILAVLDI